MNSTVPGGSGSNLPRIKAGTPDQERAAALIRDHDYRSSPLVICGYAGTGKSWLARTVVPDVFSGKRLVYAAPTNKAARGVLRPEMEKTHRVSNFPRGTERRENGFTAPLSVGTVFSLLNLPRTEEVCAATGKPCEEGGQCAGCRRLDELDPAVQPGAPPKPCRLRESELQADPLADPMRGAQVVIVDEASMVSAQDYQRLCSECAGRGIPLLLFGDPGQLPPVGERESSALLHPAIVMEAIQRQKLDSPIIRLSWMARTGQYLSPGSLDSLVHVLDARDGAMVSSAVTYFARQAAGREDMIICPGHQGDRPSGRVWLNTTARAALGFTSPWPQPGDVVLSYSNDYYLWRAFNGSRGTVLEAGEPFRTPGTDEPVLEMTVQFSEHRDPRRFLTLARRFNYPANKLPEKIRPSVPLRASFRQELEAAETSRPDDLTPKERRMLRDGKEPLLHLDYGYALTAWKAQGSEAPGVLVTGMGAWMPVPREQYLYTAITRARTELAVC